MNIIHRLVSILCPVVLLGIGAVQFVRFVLERFWNASQAQMYVEAKLTIFNSPITIGAWWFLVAILPLSLWAMHLWNLFTGSSRVLSLKSTSGNPLKIKEAAINRFIHDDLLLLPFVKNVRIDSRAPSGAVAIDACVWITSAGPLDNLQIQLLDRIREALQTGLGISQVSGIDLKFESVQLTKTQVKNRAAVAKQETALEPYPANEAIPFEPYEADEKPVEVVATPESK
jgi:hypothetical protein